MLLSQEAKHWEASFRVYERGVALFKYPHVGPIWAAYLKSFVDRYKGTKLERARDLFESALQGEHIILAYGIGRGWGWGVLGL